MFLRQTFNKTCLGTTRINLHLVFEKIEHPPPHPKHQVQIKKFLFSYFLFLQNSFCFMCNGKADPVHVYFSLDSVVLSFKNQAFTLSIARKKSLKTATSTFYQLPKCVIVT